MINQNYLQLKKHLKLILLIKTYKQNHYPLDNQITIYNLL